MNKVLKRIDVWFKKEFKKRFLLFVSLPLVISTLFVLDFIILPGETRTEYIVEVYEISINQTDALGYSRSPREKGYYYVTTNNYTFSTMERWIREDRIDITITPLFNSVNAVWLDNNRKVDLQTGFNGINGVMLIFCSLGLLISVIYVLLVKKISENARLNLKYFNGFIIVLWGIIIYKYGI